MRPTAGGRKGAGSVSKMDGDTAIFSEAAPRFQAPPAPLPLRSRGVVRDIGDDDEMGAA